MQTTQAPPSFKHEPPEQASIAQPSPHQRDTGQPPPNITPLESPSEPPPKPTLKPTSEPTTDNRINTDQLSLPPELFITKTNLIPTDDNTIMQRLQHITRRTLKLELTEKGQQLQSDTGANCSATNDRSILWDFRNLTTNITISTFNKDKTDHGQFSATGTGIIKIVDNNQDITNYVTLFAPDASGTIISPDRFMTEERTVSVFPFPTALIGLDSLSNQCSPVTATITNRSTGAPGVCFWDFGNGIRDSTCRNVFVQKYVADTTTLQYLIKLEVSNLCGVSMDTFQLTVTSPGVQAFFSLDDYDICPNKTIQFRDASTPLPGRVFWKFGDGGVSQDPNPTYVYRDSDTTLTVTLIARTGCGYDSLSRVVNIQPLPEVNFATERYACEGQPTQFLNRSDERASFRWDFGDGQIDSLSYSPQHIYQSGGGMVNVSLTIKDFPNGCENTVSKPILVRTKPTADFAVNGDTTGCAPFTVILQNLSRGANRWEWDLGNNERSELENPGTVFSAGTYDITLIASYENICRDTFRLDDAINADDCGVFIPNVFSPNGDGKNDFFTIYGGPFSATKIRMMRIYTRWGEMVFERENFDMDNLSGWDGRIKGDVPIPGVYVYWVEIEQLGGQTKMYKGDVVLMR